MKEIEIHVDNHNDFQRSKVDDKIAIVVTFLEDHTLEWSTNKTVQKTKAVTSLIWVGFMELQDGLVFLNTFSKMVCKSWWWMFYSCFQNFWRISRGSLKLPKALKPMALKSCQATPHNKVF